MLLFHWKFLPRAFGISLRKVEVKLVLIYRTKGLLKRFVTQHFYFVPLVHLGNDPTPLISLLLLFFLLFLLILLFLLFFLSLLLLFLLLHYVDMECDKEIDSLISQAFLKVEKDLSLPNNSLVDGMLLPKIEREVKLKKIEVHVDQNFIALRVLENIQAL